MARYRLMPPNFQDLDYWKEFCDAIDHVWKNEIDNPQKAFRLLRDTYAMTFTPYGQLPRSSYPNNEYDPIEGTQVFDINNFFDFSRKPEFAEFTLTSPTVVINLALYGATNVKTGFPQTLVILYRKQAGEWLQIPPSQYTATSNDLVEVNYIMPSGTDIKIVERISSPELSSQLRYLGFQFPKTEFISRASSVVGSPALQVLASNYGDYLNSTKGTPQVFDFFGFCLASEFTLKRLWTTRTKPQATINYLAQSAPYRDNTTLTYAKTVSPPTVPQNTIPLSVGINVVTLPYSGADASVYTRAPGEDYVLRTVSDYYPTPNVPAIVTDLIFSTPLPIGTDILVLYKNARLPYGTFYEEDDPIIGTPVWLGGDWFPTSHVNLRYSLAKYGGSLDSDEIRQFFNYVANLNLVLDQVILTDTVNLKPSGVGIAAQLKITQL